MGVRNLDDFLDLTKEDMANFVSTGVDAIGDMKTLSFAALDIKKILALQAWFASHDDASDATWATLNLSEYNNGKPRTKRQTSAQALLWTPQMRLQLRLRTRYH